ncbi:MAG: radical SAM protein, partial [Chitinophagaceae bacterium]|nr:radical SAM protein [Chitinophagaceae bacterium]
MAGIYVHIPFCRKACHYCDFHFSTTLHQLNDLVDALLREIELRAPEAPTQAIETIYFGGGTPSILSNTDLHRILEAIHKQYSVSSNAEITLEANPDDIQTQRVKDWMR